MPVKRYKGAKAKADRLFSEIIRAIGYCEAQGFDERPCSRQLQCAHIVGRVHSATRTDLRNAFCLCFAHHSYFHRRPVRFTRFVYETWAGKYADYIHQKADTPTKVDWDERVEFLQRIKNSEIGLEEARELEE